MTGSGNLLRDSDSNWLMRMKRKRHLYRAKHPFDANRKHLPPHLNNLAWFSFFLFEMNLSQQIDRVYVFHLSVISFV